MKKALALVLALVLALSMAVSAFAANVTLSPVPAGSTSRVNIETVDFNYADGDAKLFAYDGNSYYFAIDGTNELKDIKLTVNGNVTAELVAYDAEKFNADDDSVTGVEDLVDFYIYNKAKDLYLPLAGVDITAEGKVSVDPTQATAGTAMKAAKTEELHTFDIYASHKADDGKVTVAGVKDIVKALNDKAEAGVWAAVPTTNVYIVKFKVADNYSAHYTTGTIKIDAYNKDTKKDVTNTLTVINDVVIFEYEQVKYAADSYKAGYELMTNKTEVKGYSDYETYVFGYDIGDVKYDYNELRTISDPYVISTTAFRAITGESIYVSTPGEAFVVDIKNVVADQKGVNFKWYGFTPLNAEGYTKAQWTAAGKTNWEIASVDFGFYGNQVIKGEFNISITPGINWFELREAFGIKVEEDDIITYYLLKDGKVAQEYKVDYATIDYSDDLVVDLDLKDTTLGQYELVLEVPAGETAGESNPNTGAESVVGVVAALAVVSLASAAAVSLKK